MWINKYIGGGCIRIAPNYDLGRNGYPNEIFDKFNRFLNETNIRMPEELQILAIPESRPQRNVGRIQMRMGDYF